MLAIVLDDMGPAVGLTRRAIRLPAPITLSFLPYANDIDALTAEAQSHGHEIFLHLPMEPIGTPDPGPNAILVGLDPGELQRRLAWAFDRVPRATGMNNHMGRQASSDPATMLKVLEEARRHGLSFVDSRTSPLSVGDALAAQLGLPHAARDVFWRPSRPRTPSCGSWPKPSATPGGGATPWRSGIPTRRPWPCSIAGCRPPRRAACASSAPAS